MSFPSGLFILRPSPAASMCRKYATGNGVNHIVTVAPQTPPVFDRQLWNIQAVHGKAGVYTITLHTHGSTFGGHWFPKDGEPIPKSPIVTSEKPYEWYIAPKEGAIPHAITIQAHTKDHSVGLYAGTNEKNEVIIISVPVVPGAEAPYWLPQSHPH
ncbi:hypothetical protein K443DRAFT_6694 [Laccaria amethystina LaAM-08-1]|uniref:Uncharacterized protein n=1 Tax=Laccaria amethystina LaAM-08-1 TaxID=1095629 RepID=A0A0C9XVX1_9AGAR|nr:hypothetical protein K443DRAFT_6694 [Laccaria amethystina LaAM-08-1]